MAELKERLKSVLDKILWLWHPALGALVIEFGKIHIAFGILWFVGFIIYEITEAKVVKDEACWDIRDFLIGMGARLFLSLIGVLK